MRLDRDRREAIRGAIERLPYSDFYTLNLTDALDDLEDLEAESERATAALLKIWRALQSVCQTHMGTSSENERREARRVKGTE